MTMTKRELKAALGEEFQTDAALARFFGIGRWAVGQWGEDDPIPELRQLQVEKKRPDLFVHLQNAA